ncbi:hypothetical protein BD289DRAFT_359878, partial [Coniella lustricola]
GGGGGNAVDGVPLDVRMRNLILKNTEKSQQETATANAKLPSAGDTPAENVAASPQQNVSLRARQKRPNQAQRRQMSFQTNIPIDHRSAISQEGRFQGNVVGLHHRHDRGHHHHERGHHHHHPGHHHRNQHHYQPNAFADPNLGQGFASGDHSGSNRHHQSSSISGASFTPALFDWRQPGADQTDHQTHQPGLGRSGHFGRHSAGHGRPFHHQHAFPPRLEDIEAGVALLERLTTEILANAEIDIELIREKENFRLLIEHACQIAITEHHNAAAGRSDFPPMSVQLRCFGSLASGFATKSSDMDLGLLSPLSHPQPDEPGSDIPRLIEKMFLEMGFGARLLSKTRVAIIKVCQHPPQPLYADLVRERTRWERGEIEDQDVDEDETLIAHEDAATTTDTTTKISSAEIPDKITIVPGHQPSPPQATTEVDEKMKSMSYQGRLNILKQGSKSMPNYYGAAKKLLRELGGRDIMNSNAATFTQDDFQILNDVCRAFVGGLTDETLRTRLQRYLSLSFDPTASTPINRSIYGVMAQIEGERMLMIWESRLIHEKTDFYEQQARSHINHWIDVQNKPKYGLDPLGYNKQLSMANDSLKKIPSISLLLLEQGQYESAAAYHSRTIQLMRELGGHDVRDSATPLLAAVVRQYEKGIYDHEIRAQVADFSSSLATPSLRAVARRHKTLQLARDFEKALEKQMYAPELVNDIEQYIELLRGPMDVGESLEAHHDYMLKTPQEDFGLIAKVRGLQDPSRMAPNQPRDRYRDKLEYPKSGIGVQCDINFSAHLALHNTHLLRCYSLTDPRVRPIVLFVKQWAKVRGINTAYRGTLSSYGYVLMVLHYLTNVARPFVCPNLQALAPPVPPNMTPEQMENTVQCKGRDIRFWRDADQIADAAQRGVLNQNTDPVGFLLRGFFEYYAQSNMMSTGHMRGFDWGRDVISIRTLGGLLSKKDKGWTGAKTVLEVRQTDKSQPSDPATQVASTISTAELDSEPLLPNATSHPPPPAVPTHARTISQDHSKPEVKEVRYRYLFAIEDPFEWDHNVARTVTHNGIVSIRDEFRRAWRIIRNAGRGQQQEDLLQDVTLEEENNDQASFSELLNEIHGKPSADVGA